MIIGEHDGCRSKPILKQSTKSAPRQLILHADRVLFIAITTIHSDTTVSDKSVIVVVRVMSRPARKTRKEDKAVIDAMQIEREGERFRTEPWL